MSVREDDCFWSSGWFGRHGAVPGGVVPAPGSLGHAAVPDAVEAAGRPAVVGADCGAVRADYDRAVARRAGADSSLAD